MRSEVAFQVLRSFHPHFMIVIVGTGRPDLRALVGIHRLKPNEAGVALPAIAGVPLVVFSVVAAVAWVLPLP